MEKPEERTLSSRRDDTVSRTSRCACAGAVTSASASGRNLQVRAPGALPLLEQERLGRPADEHVGAVFSHQYIANLLPGQTQTHETAEKIAVVERSRLVKAATQRGNRVLLRAEGQSGRKCSCRRSAPS